MNLKTREKYLLGILLSLLILISYYNFIYKPQHNKILNLKRERTQYQEKIDNLNLLIKDMPRKKSNIKILNSKIQDKTSKLYPEIIQEKIIVEIDKLMNDSNIAGSLNFTEINNEPIKNDKGEDKKNKNQNKNGILYKLSEEYNTLDGEKKYSTKKAEDTKAPILTDEPIEQIKANVNFKGKYEDILKFVKSVDEYTRKIAISNMRMSQNTPNEISGTMTLEFFAIPKLDGEDEEYFNWPYNNAYGKANMFDSSESISLNNSLESTNELKTKNYDFVMSLRPINSDLPTVTLGKAMDLERKSYVYADNPKEEKVEMYITEKNNKYYFKYKTSRNSYPINFKDIGEEFNPKQKDINFKIYSNKRNSDKDKSTVKLEIYNKTSKTVNIFVEDDDANRPRININANSGSVEVKRN